MVPRLLNFGHSNFSYPWLTYFIDAFAYNIHYFSSLPQRRLRPRLFRLANLINLSLFLLLSHWAFILSEPFFTMVKYFPGRSMLALKKRFLLLYRFSRIWAELRRLTTQQACSSSVDCNSSEVSPSKAKGRFSIPFTTTVHFPMNLAWISLNVFKQFLWSLCVINNSYRVFLIVVCYYYYHSIFPEYYHW